MQLLLLLQLLLQFAFLVVIPEGNLLLPLPFYHLELFKQLFLLLSSRSAAEGSAFPRCAVEATGK